MEEIMNIKIDNNQNITGLNEIYDFALDYFNQKQIKFKQSILNGNKIISKRIQKALDGLFDEDQNDSLPQIFESYRIPEKVSMQDRQKLLIFYHIGVLEKYQQINTVIVEKDQNSHSKIKNDQKLAEKNEKLRKQQRKNLREYAIKIIKGNYPFVIKPALNRFNQVMEEVFIKDLREKQVFNDEKSIIEFQQKLISSISIEEADFIYECYQSITIVLTQIIEFLFSRMISNNIPTVSSGYSDLYQTIFSGQIVEKLIFNSSNKTLFQASVDALFHKTNEMKYIDMRCYDNELVQVLQQRNASLLQQMNSESIYEKDLNKYQSVIIQTTLNNYKGNISCSNNTILNNTQQNMDSSRNQTVQQNQNEILNHNQRCNDVTSNIDSVHEIECIEDNKQYAESIFFTYSFNDEEQNRSHEISQSMKVYLQENYKEYLNEIYSSIEDCLSERYFFKKIKKVSKLVVKIQEKFQKKSQNKRESIKFVLEKDNWYNIIFMILKSFLSFRPQSHQDFFYLFYTINLIQIDEYSYADLFDIQAILETILNIGENNDKNQ